MFVEVTSKQNAELNYGIGTAIIESGKSYIVHDSWVNQIPGTVGLLGPRFKKYNISIDANDKRILMIRTIGGGDVLFLSGIAKYIKHIYPSVQIDFAIVDKQHSLVETIPVFDNVISMPIKSELFDTYDYYIEVSGLIEGDANVDRNVYDVYLEHVGAEFDTIGPEFKRPALIKKTISKNTQRIGIHPFANDPIRAVNPQLANGLALKLMELGYEVIIFSSYEEKQAYTPLFGPFLKWSCDLCPNFDDLASLICSCQHTITTDSLISHLSQACGTHNITIYGPFSGKSRSLYYENMTTIDTQPECRCSLHHVGRCPKGFTHSPCINVDPDIIINIITNDIATLDYPEISVPTVTYY